MKKTGSKSLLLDANAVIDYFKGNKAVVSKIKSAKTIFLPAIVLGELYFGANNSSNKQKHIRQIKKFINFCEILTVDSTTAIHYGTIKATLKKKGKPIPENDIWIAAIARQNKLTILSNDNHFRNIDSIALASW